MRETHNDSPWRRRRRRRLWIAVMLTLSVIMGVALTGGVGYTASAVGDGSSAVMRLATGSSSSGPSGGKSTGSTPLSTSSFVASTAAVAQYGNKVTICHHPRPNPTSWVTISVKPSAVKAHLKHGDTLGPCPPLLRRQVKQTRLRVSISPLAATLTSGIPIKVTVVTRNVGRAPAWAVLTCVSLPRGVTVTSTAGGYASKGLYCWRASALSADTRTTLARGAAVAAERATYTFLIRGDARLAGRVQLAAQARALNAAKVGASSRLIVKPGKVKGQGGFTG